MQAEEYQTNFGFYEFRSLRKWQTLMKSSREKILDLVLVNF